MGLFSFLGGGKSSNDDLVDAQKKEAAEAKRNEQDRAARMDYGRNKIKAIFRGGEVGPYEQWTEVPKYKTVRPITGYKTSPGVSGYNDPHGGDHGSGISNLYGMSRTGGGERVPIYGDPEQVQSGTTLALTPTGETETFSGIGDSFYDDYYNTITDYFAPQLQDQYEEAKSQNLFDLARRGLLRSSVGAENTANVEKELGLGQLEIANRAQGQRDNLIDDVNRAETNAISMIQGADDPSIGIDAALREATAIQSRGPDLSGGLGNIFSSALNAYSNYADVANARRYRDTAIAPRRPTQSSGASYS